ncbi:MAG: hypothetical protein L3J52_08840, partial [Proteobacteria bacterium]|nr:hypothetical protein [Pseudomonadota bacterium]
MKQTKCFDQYFYFRDWKFDILSGKLLLNYEIENQGVFSERFIFPDIDVDRVKNNSLVIGHAMDLLHWMAGVSYYKSGLAGKLIVEKKLPGKDIADWLENSWYHGLAELAYQNNVSLKNRINFPCETVKLIHAKKLNLKARSLVPIGGGKDSLVSIESLKLFDEDSCLFVVGNSEFIPLVAKKTGLPLLQIKRQLDPK